MKKLLFLLFLIPILSFSQEDQPPKVGVVLSGGGAKGLAHIGALKVLEEAGIKIDYIGGASMGAIIGGLYASGYSAAELDSIAEKTNFNILIQDALPRSAKTFYEKRESEKYVITLPFDKFKVGFPSGLSRGQNVYNLISRLTFPLENRRDFTKMPIPFFCVATNVGTGEEVILDHGYLPQAISASAALPTVFRPVRIGDTLFTDGGVANNYPVEEMRKRGADIVIGIDVQDSLAGQEDLNSAFDIISQITSFTTTKNMKKKIENTDIYIDPEISTFSVLSFDQSSKLIEAGAKAARKHMDALKKVASLQKEESPRFNKVEIKDSLYISDIQIEGNQDYPRSYIIGKLKLDYPLKVAYQDFNNGINNLSVTGNFNRVNYRLVPIDEGYVLKLDLEENPSKMFLKMALHYDKLYQSAALVNLTRKSLFLTNDVVSLDLVLGDNIRYNFEYYIDKGFYWSIGLRSRFNGFEKNVGIDFVGEDSDLAEVDINKISIKYSDYTNQFYVETLFGKIFSLGVGAEHKYLKVDSETIGGKEGTKFPATIFDKTHYISAFGTLNLDTYDNKYFPTKGLYFHGDFHFYFYGDGIQEDFSKFSIAKGEVGYAFSPLPRLTTRLVTGTGFQIGKHENNSLNFFLGGFGNGPINNIIPFYGYDFMELSGDSYVKGMLELDYQIFSKHHLSVSANFANVDDQLYANGDLISSPDYSGYALGYGIDTFMGPLQIKYTYTPEKKSSLWFFSLGFWF